MVGNDLEYYIQRIILNKSLLINCIPLLSELTGVGRYIFETCKHLPLSENFDLRFYYGYRSKELIKISDHKAIKAAGSFLLENPKLRTLAKHFLFNTSKILAPSFDIYWEPNFIPLNHIKSKNIITTINDFSFEHFRENIPEERIHHFDKNFYKNIYKSNHIICISNYVKREVLERLNYKEEEISVIHLGVRHNIFKVYKDSSTAFILPEKFILFVGSIEPRKNLKRLLLAYDALDNTIKNEYKLVLVGLTGWKNEEIFDLINKNKQNIYYLGYIDDENLAKIYNKADLFVFPSIYEGFGLPVLEAMACGTPVLTSDCSSLPEVGGDAVEYCDPYNMEEITYKMTKILENEKMRENMRNKGLLRVKKFTWGKTAAKHMELFNQIANMS